MSVAVRTASRKIGNTASKVARLHAQHGDHCHWCHRLMDFTNDRSRHYRTLDHLVDREIGGGNGIANLVLACWECNQKRARRKHLARRDEDGSRSQRRREATRIKDEMRLPDDAW